MTDPKTFRAACELLWGPQYRSEAARQLKISLRTLMRYNAGESPIPEGIVRRLHTLLNDRSAMLDNMMEELADHLREDA